MAQDDEGAHAGRGDPIGGRYAQYTLGVLVVVYVLNFLDRQIISVLSVKIQADLGIDDAQIGFLYGTAFAVFYAIFGIPLGRLADVWVRRSLISVGLAFWSGMTTLSGFTTNFTQLAIARIGVGVGEASATPAAFSMLSDSFPAARRATALSIYSSGLFIGAGLGLFLGGAISTAWDDAWAGTEPPLGLVGWRVAFILVGIPGILVALWVRSLREPVRGQVDGIVTPQEPHPFRVFGRELCAVIPGLTVVYLALTGASATLIAANLASGGALLFLAWLLIGQTGDTAQWIALAIGLYAAVSWAQGLRLRDAPTFSLIFGTPTLLIGTLGFSCLAFVGYALGFWVTPYAIRELGVSEAEAGLWLGGSGALGGLIGVTLGGVLADRLRQITPAGRIYVGVLNAVLPAPVAWLMLTTDSIVSFYLLSLPLNIFSSLWIGPGASTVQDLVLPRMRGTASAAYLLSVTFIGLALGPYTVGRLSVAIGDLGSAMLWALTLYSVGLGLLLLAIRTLARDQSTVRERALAAGEADL